MHGEAFAWLRATLGLAGARGLRHADAGRARADAHRRRDARARPRRRRARLRLRQRAAAAAVDVAPFEIDATPLRNVDFLRFVDAGGYDDAALWPGAAGAWRARQAAAPSAALAPAAPTANGRCAGSIAGSRSTSPRPSIHVSAWEAEAYCRWAGRRLPSAAEWELRPRATRASLGQSVWEWSADAFLPYPGFVAGPYADYSKPWFGDHRELRGGSFATHERLHDPRYRNFFVADRNDVFAGFRTAAPSR